jgi:hypothetical protein
MFAIAFLFVRVLCDCFKSRRRLEAEVLVLRHQLNVLQQRVPRRLYLSWINRALFVWLYRGFPRILDAITIVRPETIGRWHRKGFSAFWRWKSRPLGGRPQVDKEVRDLIRRMSFENPLWGAPHIHGELLKLGFDVAQSTVSKYMVPRRDRPSQTWKTFLHNHADGIAPRGRLRNGSHPRDAPIQTANNEGIEQRLYCASRNSGRAAKRAVLRR